ncbi:MAG: transglutaminaseTgpA domain-containing protein [Chromatiales bacterium]|jgi:transglutaminase-like putative cysteine protease|nr:transglutaminaseTgpA domain-containing protein [Chromatiales bacterium]
MSITSAPLTRRALAMLLLALTAAAAPHAFHLPLGIMLFVIVCGLWRWMVERAGWPLPGRTLRAVLTIAALSFVVLIFGTVFGRDAGTALLSVMLGLKLLELRNYRDAMLTLFLGCFLVVVMAFHSQEIPVAIALLTALLLLTMALIELHRDPSARGPMRNLQPAAMMLLAAAPLAALMFVLFPRLPAPLWGLPADAHGKTTGLSETMSPGAISQLATSDEIAFRVLFDGAPPAAEDLYWRGPVFWHTDGRNWSVGNHPGMTASPRMRPDFTPLGAPINYTVMLEPTGQSWLFALDLPYTAPAGGVQTEDMFLLTGQPVREPRHYAVTSYSAHRTPELSAAQRERALQLPDANPRTLALGRAWQEEGLAPETALQRALAHFHNEEFHYTLSPPMLSGADPVDSFMFETRAGFCEHYAAAFTVLMRAAGVPARIVTGYQGGERNPIGDHLIVRQRDAHAWAEVWLPAQGWTRVDPTAAVAPERIQHGSADLLARSGINARTRYDFGLRPLLDRVSASWDALNTRWNAWVLAYGPDAQSSLLARFGLRSWLAMTLALAGTIAIVLVLITLLTRSARQPRDPLVELHTRFRSRLARFGIMTEASEGPIALAHRVRQRNPELAANVDMFTALYVAMRYGKKNHTPSDLRHLRRTLANLGR